MPRRAILLFMKRIMLTTALICAPLIGAAQDSDEDGLSLMERGARDFLDGVMKEMGPALRELEGLSDKAAPALRNFAREMGPKLAEILDEVEDWSVYAAPEILPNGDIISRRKPEPPMEKPQEPTEPAPQIEL